MHAEAAFYANILHTMSSGVVTLDPGGRITTFNPRASALLGVPAESALGRTFAELFFGEAGSDEFAEAVLAAIYDQETVHHRRIAYTAAGSTLQLDVTTALLRDEAGGGSGRLGVLVVFDDTSEIDRLRAAEQEMAEELRRQHGELQQAYRGLEEKSRHLEVVGRRLRLAQLGGAAVVLLAIAGIGYATVGRTVLPASFSASRASEPADGGIATVTVQRTRVTSTIGIVGTIEPGDTVGVVSPFDGLVRERRFEYGNRVERGAVLFLMDTAELENKLREARSNFITADQKLREMLTWSTNTEVLRARRSLAAANVAWEDSRQRLAETRRLLDRGIVSAEELRSAQQQERSNASQQEAAAQDLTATLARGSAENRRIAELQQETAKARLDELEGQFREAEVRAPVAGVALLPPQSEGTKNARIERGTRLSQGQAALLVGNLEQLAVRARIDEVAIAKVKVGQRAEISADALAGLTASGRVVAVSAQGTSDGPGRPPSFDVLVAVDPLPAGNAGMVRVGMTANVLIVAHENPDAVVVPAAVIREEGGRRTVVATAGGQTRRIPVEVIGTTEDGVEISGPLEDGMQLVLP